MFLRRDNFALAGCSLLLGLGLVFEFGTLSTLNPAPELSNPLSFAATANSTQISAAFPVPAAVEGWVAAASARPLFSRGRSPVQEAEAFTPPPVLPRLTGVMISSNAKIGIFSATNGRSIIAREGTQLGVFKILSITSDGVQISGPAGMQSIQIHYDINSAVRITASSAYSDSPFSGSDTWPSKVQVTQQ